MNRYVMLCALIMAAGTAGAQAPPGFDFTRAGGEVGWEATHDVPRIERTEEGLRIEIGGADPFITGPARDYPEDQPLWVQLRLKCEQGGVGQLFYFQGAAQEIKSVRFLARANTWDDVRLPLPPLGRRYRLRFDPPGATGSCTLATIAFELRPKDASTGAAPSSR